MFVFSLGFFGLGASWVFISIHRFGGASVFLAGLLTALFIFYLSFLQAGFGWVFAQVTSPWKRVLAFPLGWVLFEILRSYLFTGFPWLLVGTAHVLSPFGALAPIGGVWLISGAVTLSASLCYYCLTEKKPVRYIALSGMALLGLLLWNLQDKSWTTPLEKTVTIALVQPSIAQELRWDPRHTQQTLLELQRLSAPYWDTVDWLIWPEGAMPVPLPDSESWLNNLANQHPSLLLTGVPALSQTGSYTNEVWAVGTTEHYQKEHLVPFGEYVPFESWLRGAIAFFDLPMSDFQAGVRTGPLALKDWSLGVAICYETAYPELMRARAKNADALLILSNDAWFGHGFAPAQHLQIAQLRARESGRMVLRATNNGFTAIINPDGTIQAKLLLDKKEVLIGEITAFSGHTPWDRL